MVSRVARFGFWNVFVSLCIAWALSSCLALTAFADGSSNLGAASIAHGEKLVAATEQNTAAGAVADPTSPFVDQGIFYVSAPADGNLVLGMKKGKRVNGTCVVLAKRKNTNLVKFRLVPLGEPGLYFVENVATGRRVSVDVDAKSGSRRNAAMITGEWSVYQQWRISANADGTVTFSNPATGSCLNLAQGVAAKGAAITVEPSNGSAAQKFVLTRTNRKKKEIVKIGVPCMMQNPELPTGCESVALANALKYWGFRLGKTTIANRWMPYGGNGVYNFIGSPRNESGWIICAPGIRNTANKFLRTKKTDVRAKAIKGKSLKSLRKYLDQGCPVVVWTTIGMGSPGGLHAYRSGYPLRTNNHAVVLTGYNPKNGAYQVSDSLAGRVWRNGKRFTSLYNVMGKQAVVLYN